MTTTIVLVGHCGPDMFMLRSAAQRIAPASTIEMVNDEASLGARLGPDHVLLVNRVLDGAFASESGIELIRGLVAGGIQARALLISNFDDAQQEAEAVGALPGFGKNALYDDDTAARLHAAMDAAPRGR